jgi:hypothetical protein
MKGLDIFLKEARMCETASIERFKGLKSSIKTLPLEDAIGTVLAHDITEIRGDFKGRAFKKGHIIREGDIEHLKRLGKDNLFVLELSDEELHEDSAALIIAEALRGEGVIIEGEPKEGRINLIAEYDGLLKVKKDALFEFNMHGDVMCATLHDNTLVKKGQLVAGTRAIPLVVKKSIVDSALKAISGGVLSVKKLKRPRAGIVITGNEVYYGRIKDAFGEIISKKILSYQGEIVGIHYAPDDVDFIEERLRGLIKEGADLLITTGGMSVDPDDVTRVAISRLGVDALTYGSSVLPGAMFLVAYLGDIPILGIPACGMYSATTVFDIVLPRVLSGERISRAELSALGHGGLCLRCKECRYPICPFGKA